MKQALNTWKCELLALLSFTCALVACSPVSVMAEILILSTCLSTS